MKAWIPWIGLACIVISPLASAHHDAFDARVEAKAHLGVAAHARASAHARVTWDWGDGETSAGADASHAYRAPGHYRVTVTARDRDGREESCERDVWVRDERRSDTDDDEGRDTDKDTDKGADEGTDETDRGAMVSVQVPVDARVELSSHHHRARGSEGSGDASASSSVSVQSYERHDAPGPAGALVALAGSAGALAWRRR